MLWLDDDAWFPPTLISVMLRAMQERPKLDALFSWCSTRRDFAPPMVWQNISDSESYPKHWQFKRGDLIAIEAGAFHCVLMRMSLLKRVGPNPFSVPADTVQGEDFAFCRRAKEIGAEMATASTLIALHVDPRDGVAYGPGLPAMLMDGNAAKSMGTQHQAPDGRIKSGEIRSYGAAVDSIVDSIIGSQESPDIVSEVLARRAITEADGEKRVAFAM